MVIFNFNDNSYWSVVWRGKTRLLAEAIYKAFKKKYGFNMKNRTIGGIQTELSIHWLCYKLGYDVERANPADIGAAGKYKKYKGTKSENWGYDYNAWRFEALNATNVVRIITSGSRTEKINLIKRMVSYL